MRKYSLKNTLNHKAVAFVTLVIILSQSLAIGQKQRPFTGVLEYKISSRDTSLRQYLPDNSMFIYSNDTIVRTENYTPQLGVQVTIRHMEKKKSYLLLEMAFGKFAIPADLSSQTGADTTSREIKYTFEKKSGKRKILGRKARRVLAYHKEFEEAIEFLYLKEFSDKYNTTFEGMPGLPVRYSVVTADGIIDYELVRISEYLPNRDLFGIPSDYERISFDDFLDRLLESRGSGEIAPE